MELETIGVVTAVDWAGTVGAESGLGVGFKLGVAWDSGVDDPTITVLAAVEAEVDAAVGDFWGSAVAFASLVAVPGGSWGVAVFSPG